MPEQKKKLTRKEKVQDFLKKSSKEVERASIVKGTQIDSSNLSKILSALEKEGKISREYKQEGRSKYVWVSLKTNSQKKMTNSQDKTTNSQKEKTISQDSKKESIPEVPIKERKKRNSAGESTNSQNKMTNSQDQLIKKLELLLHEHEALQEKYQKLEPHELSESNIIKYFMGTTQAKLYELRRFFDLNQTHEIDMILKNLYSKKTLLKTSNNWYYLNPNYKTNRVVEI